MSPAPRVRFSLTTPEKEAVEDGLLQHADLVARGVEQPDGTFLFDLDQAEFAALRAGIAATVDRSDEPRAGALLEAVWRRLSAVSA